VTYLAAHPAFADTDGGTEARTPVEQMLAAKGPYLLCVANTYPHKNVHTLARAYMSLYERIPHRLVIVGNPGIGEGLVQEALASLRDPGRVVRLRGLASGNLAALYQNADLFVFPSLHEGFGLPVLEAMMAGLPVVTSRKGAIPEVGGDCVRYADPGDAEDLARAVREMLELSGEQRRAWVARARQRAAQFSWEQTADATVACLRDACGNNA
jgi:glycosyltransferase involved in cell wall biosynthesis